MNKIKIGIVGYGNLAKGVEASLMQNDDMELKAVFTRRNPQSIKINTKGVDVLHVDSIPDMKDDIDVLILCGGSANDLPVQTPEYAKLFTIVDSFDNHSRIPEHYENVNKSALESGNVAVISVGWDPGLFSLNRILAKGVLPKGYENTFWGPGVSQGHTNAIKKIDGVRTAVQYTLPIDSAVESARKGELQGSASYERHNRQCFVVAEEGADKKRIENEIKNMPAYFADYHTEVNFISEEEFNDKHRKMSHGGMVIRSGYTGLNDEFMNTIEYKLTLESNPMFTSSVLVAYARAAYRMKKEGMSGCKTIFDIPLSYIVNMSREELLATML